MFDFKHRIEFQNGESTQLFGEGYFCDKSVFWHSHQSQLEALYEKTLLADFPIKITDLTTQSFETIANFSEFKAWLTVHQPFRERLQEIEKRNNTVYSEIREKCNAENTNEFEYYWEIWGVNWYPWTLEINGHAQTFTFNDLSEFDLIELVKLDKIAVVETYETHPADDRMGRKRYRICEV